ncbi:unnamed protein product [Rotaria sp. Silwood1]|nr:unnamed protein product [Rotaria sp. Silwood1]CAF4901581.1 unnamed protein product [Rotaria sp. Silwood1]CAF4908800.1 unnamed protein product [Rotaria sp. Silwood1]
MTGAVGDISLAEGDPITQMKDDRKNVSPFSVTLDEKWFSKKAPKMLSKSIQAMIKGLTGKLITLKMIPNKAMDEVQTQSQDAGDILVERQHLMFTGEQLENDRTLAYYKIPKESTIQLVLPLQSEHVAILDPSTIDPIYDYDFTNIKDTNKRFTRGGIKYVRPCGWKRYAIKVSDKYEDLRWLGQTNGPGEWPVSYHGTGKNEANTIAMDGFYLSKGKKFAFGHGVYSTPDINVATKYAKKFSFKGKNYLVLLQNRVNPTTLVKISADRTGVGEYWASPSYEDIRAYGICIRKL